MHASATCLAVVCATAVLARAVPAWTQDLPTEALQLEAAVSTLERGRYAQAAVVLDGVLAALSSPPDLNGVTARTAFAAIDTHLRGTDPEWAGRIEAQLDRLLLAVEDNAITDEDDRLRTLEVVSSISLLVRTRHARTIADRWSELVGAIHDGSEDEITVRRLRAEAAGLSAAGGDGQARERLRQALEMQEKAPGDNTAGLVKTLTEFAAVADSAESARRSLERAIAVAHADPLPSIDSTVALARLISILADRQEPVPPPLVQKSVAYRDQALDMAPSRLKGSLYRRALEAFSASVEIYALKDLALRGTMLMGVRPTVQHGESLLNLTIAMCALGGAESPFVEAWLRELAKYLRFFAKYDEAQALESRASAIARR